MNFSEPRPTRTAKLAALAAMVLIAVLVFAPSVDAFRFSIVPGTTKCFTNDPPEEGRYELRYRMTSGLAPFVSVSVTAASGRVLLEHEPAKPDTKTIFNLKQRGTIAICFNSNIKAATATSLNVTVSVVDAEDAELTRMKKQSYSTSSPIALGAGQGSGSLRQMKYIGDMLRQMRHSIIAAASFDKDVAISVTAAEKVACKTIYAFGGGAVVIMAINYWRLRRYMYRNKFIVNKQKV